jgi:hypothetical protein
VSLLLPESFLFSLHVLFLVDYGHPEARKNQESEVEF